MITSITQVIERGLIEAGMSKTQLATAFGMSPQALNQRFRTGKFSYQELQKIAEIMGAKLVFKFEFE